MSWESTIPYYRVINETVRRLKGELHSAKLLLYSVDFAEIERLQSAGDWDRAGALLAQVAKRLEAAGADFLVLCTNTMHKVLPAIESSVEIPALHIADATADELRENGLRIVGLLGTRFTMEQAFYRERLERHGLSVLIPDEAERREVHDIIYQELCCGIVRGDSKSRYLQVINKLQSRGAQAVVLGCTEIGLLIGQADARIPLLDTAHLHARKAALMAVEDVL